MTWILVLLAALVLALGAAAFSAVSTLRWLARETSFDGYFKRPVAERRAFKAEVARRVQTFLPVLRLVPRAILPDAPTSTHAGVEMPKMICPEDLVARAIAYEPTALDVFVATQMKCGTTWAQQIVYEVLMRGRGDLSDGGHRHMYAVSPWIESSGAVRLEDAPLVGPEQKRIIKTHLPASLCPYSEAARYVYVIRHPVACFSSTVDFTQMLGGPFARDRERALDWYCSDAMWWGSWAAHVEGWWQRAQAHSNVLFLHYEHMLEDLGGAVDQVAALLGIDLSPDERATVIRKSDYQYMKANEEVFEMAAPTPFSEGGTFFVSGKSGSGNERGGRQVERERIAAFCQRALEGASYPIARYYPDMAKD